MIRALFQALLNLVRRPGPRPWPGPKKVLYVSPPCELWATGQPPIQDRAACEHEESTEKNELGDSICLGCGMALIYCHGCSDAGGAGLPIYHAPPACSPRCEARFPAVAGGRCERSLIGEQPHPGDHTIWTNEGPSSTSWKSPA